MTVDLAPTLIHTVTLLAAGPHAVPWPYDPDSHIFQVETSTGWAEVLPSDVTVTPAASRDQGTAVVSPSFFAQHVGKRFRIIRATALEQGWEGLSAREKGLEAQLDKMTMHGQETRAALSRFETRAEFILASVTEDAAQVAEDADRAEAAAAALSGATTMRVQIIEAVQGQSIYTHDAAAEKLELAQDGHILFGASPYGPLTFGVDYSLTDDGGVAFTFAPVEGDFYHVVTLPNVTNSEAQALITAYKAELAATIDEKLAGETFALQPLVQEKVNEFSLGYGTTEIFTGAANTPQGIAHATVGGQQRVYLLQKVAGGSWAADERMRIVELVLTNDGTAISHATFSPPLNFGHQMISARVVGGQVWIYGSIPVDGAYVGDDIGKGFARIPYKGASTSQAEMEIFPLLGMSGTAHPFAHLRRAYVYADETHLVLLVSDASDDPEAEGDIESPDSQVLVYDRAEVEAAVNPLTVMPKHHWQRTKPKQVQNQYVQGACISRGLLWVQCGYVPPLVKHMIQVWTLNGDLVREFSVDGPAGDYTYEQLLGTTSLGIPTSFEPEGLTVDQNGDVIQLCMEVWRTPGSVVSWRGRNFAAAAASVPAGHSPDRLASWVPTSLAASEAWNIATSTYASGATVRRAKVLHRIKAPSGGAREKPLNSGKTLADSSSFLALGNSSSDLSIPFNEALSLQWFGINAQTKLEFAAFTGGRRFRLRDVNPGADLTKYFQIEHVTTQAGLARDFTQIRASGGALAFGAWLNLYGGTDVYNPYTINFGSGQPEGEAGSELKLTRTKMTLNVPAQIPGQRHCVAASGPVVSLTGTTAETQLAAFTIPGGLMGPRGYLAMTLQTGQTNDTSNKTLSVRVNGQNIVSSTAAFTGSGGTGRPMIWKNTGAVNAQVIQGAAAENGLAETASAPTYTNVNTAADFTVTVHGQLADASDELLLVTFIIEAVYMA